MTDQIQQLHARIAELEAENKGLQVFAASHQRTIERCLDLKAECAELEAMLDAIGAGGVGQSIQPLVQADTAAQQEPVAWRVHPFDYGVGYKGVYALTEMPERVEMWKRKGWKVEPLYTTPQSTRQLLTDEQIMELAEPFGAFEYGDAQGHKRQAFARAIEEAHGIGSTHG